MIPHRVARIVGIGAVAFFVITYIVSVNHDTVSLTEDIARRLQTLSASALRAPVNKVFKRGSAPTILFVVNTHEKNHETRVEDIRKTYLPRIHEKSSLDLIFVTSQMTDGNPDMFPSTCPMGYWEDSCKRADMMTIAGGYLRRPGMEVFDWIFFLDDDAFILPDNIQRVIMEGMKQEKNQTAVFGIDGCVHDACRGICGGGGYYMNRETLFHVLHSGDKKLYPSLRDETDFYDEQCGRCGDLTITRAMVDFHGVPLKRYPMNGIYVWDALGGKTDADYIRSLQMTDPLPWLYHYPARDRFVQFQSWVDEFGSNKKLED